MSDCVSSNTLAPSPNRGDPPEFWKLESKKFEELTCSLLDKEPGIRTADLYHLDGQPQFGIDVIGWSTETGRIVVASCKCYQVVTAGQIADWSDDFLKHWSSHWETRGVQRFILAVSAPVHARKLVDEVSAQHTRFQTFGIEYEVWSPRQYQEKLRPHPGIVSQFLGRYWVSEICGTPTPSELANSSVGVLIEHLSQQIVPLQTALSGEVDVRLDSLKARLREERPGPIVSELTHLRNSTFWLQLPPSTRAKCLRFLASAQIQNDDTESAARLAAEADGTSPQGGETLHALLHARKGESEQALRILESVTEPEALELKVALLLEQGDLDAAAEALKSLPPVKDGPRSIEFARLNAFLLLFGGDRVGALKEIERAESQAPRWLSIQHAGAVIRYAFALSPVLGSEFFTCPVPIARELVREDEASQDGLKHALQTFSSLAKQRESKSAILRDEIWALACDCNIVSRSKQAEERCQELIRNKPAFPEVIGWAIARGYDFDRPSSIRALSESIEKEPADPNEVLACSWLLTLENRDEDALAVLEKHETVFQGEGALLAFRARLRSLKGFDVESSKESEQTVAEQRLIHLIAQSSDEGPWDEVESLFENIAVRRPGAIPLLAAAGRLAAAARWEFLACNADHVLKFATASAVQIAIHAAYNTGDSPRALELLSEYRHVFPGGELPRVLRQIQARAMANAGQHREALRVAEFLAMEADAPREKMLAADIRIGLGDVRGALPIIRASLSANSIEPAEALRLSRLVAVEDKELAKRLWKEAQSKGVPDEFAGVAHAQALRLGLEQEAQVYGAVLSKLAATPGSGTIFLTLDELKDRFAAWNHNRANFLAAYLDGKAPFHIVSQLTRLNLAEHYFLGTFPIDDVIPRLPLMLRHGARSAEFNAQPSLDSWNVYVDVTSLLLASQLGILEILERSVHSMTVPKSIQTQLIEFRDGLEHPQPARLEFSRQVARAVQEGRIGVLASTLNPSGGPEPTFDSTAAWRVSSEQPVGGENGGPVTSIRAVIDGLRQNGKLDEYAHARAVGQLASAESTQTVVPPPGTTLVFLSDTLQIAATVSPLEAILSIYNVLVETEFANFHRHEVTTGDYRKNCSATVDALRHHVADKLLTGEYKTLAAPAAIHEKGEPEAISSESVPLEQFASASGLLELLRCTPTKDAIFLCDDRHLTGYPSIGVAPLVGIYDVLSTLRRSGHLSVNEYYERILRLRRSVAMFLPLEKDELMFHLDGAPIVDGAVKETDALTTLRRYAAWTVLLEEHLKIGDYPALQAGRPDETWVLVSLRRLVDDCIVAVWTSKTLDEEKATAKAEWLWSCMRVERHLGTHPSIRNDIDGVRTYVAVTICSAICTAFQLVTGVSEARKRAFSQWLEDSLASRLDADQHLCEKVYEQLIQLIRGLSFDSLDQDDKLQASDVTAAYYRQVFAMFPKAVRDRLELDATVQPLLKTKTISVVTVGPIHIERASFFRAVEKAIKFGRSTTQVQNTTSKAKFRRSVAGVSLLFEGKEYAIDDDAFRIFRVEAPDELMTLLHQHPEWFEREQTDREQIINHILQLPDAQQRFTAVDTARRDTLWHRYDALRQQLSDAGGVSMSSFAVPTPNEVLNHLRLTEDDDGTFEEKWERAAEAIISDFGLQQCFLRLASLPIPLPSVFLYEFSRATVEVRQALLTECSSVASRSPTHFFHALSLLDSGSRVGSVAEAYERVVSHVLERWEVLGDAMGALLTWTESSARTKQEWRSVNSTVQIVAFWLHASNLMGLLNNNADSASLIAERFNGFKTALSSDGVLGRLALSRDIASPSAYTSVGLLYGGLNYVANSRGGGDVLSTEQWSQVVPLTRTSETINPWILVSRESTSNLTGTFLKFKHAVLPDPVVVTPASIEQYEAALVDLLENSPNSTLGWIHIHALSRVGLSDAVVEKVPSFLEHADMVELSAQVEYPFLGCRGLAGCARLYGTANSRERIANQIVRLAERFALQHQRSVSSVEVNSTDSRGELLTELVEASVLLCRGNDVAEGFRAFASMSSRVVAAWPTTAKVMRVVLGQMCNDSLLEDSGQIWPEYMRLRARR
jgi:hypothetical protein